jgi:hypothetical protein
MLNLRGWRGEREIESGERRGTFYRPPMRFGPDLWGLAVAVGQIRRMRGDSVVEGPLGQPLGSGRGRKGTREGVGGGGEWQRVGVVRECRGLKYLYLYALLFSSLPRPAQPAQCRRTTAIWKSQPPTMYFTSTSRRTSRHPLLRSPASPTSRTT